MGERVARAFYPKSIWQVQLIDILDPIFFISLFLFFIAITANFIYIGDPVFGDLASRSVTLAVLAIAGLASEMYLDQTVKREKGPLFDSVFVQLDETSTKIVMVWLIIGLGGLIIINLLFGSGTSASFILPSVVFGTVGAIGEELFFLSMQAIIWDILMFSKTLKKTKYIKEIFGVGFITVLFTFFHTVIYAGQISALLYVTGLRLIGSIIYQITRRPSIPILIHLINNLLAISGFLTITGGLIFG